MGSKKKSPDPTKVHTLIGSDTEVHGDISFDGGLFVDGTVVGNVEAKADSSSMLNISDKGSIEGRVRAHHITLNGTVIGDVYASERIELATKAKVTGNIYYNLIEIAIGAEVNGQMVHATEMTPPLLTAQETSTERMAPEVTGATDMAGVAEAAK